MSTMPPYSPPNPLAASLELEKLRIELSQVQNAQQTAEIALAREREAGVCEGVRTAIGDAICREREAYVERDRARRDREEARVQLDEVQLALEKLERDLAGLAFEKRVLERENKQLNKTRSPRTKRPSAMTRTERRSAFIEMMRYRTRSHTLKGPRNPVSARSTPFNSPLPSASYLSDEVRLSLPPSDDPSFVSWTFSAHADTTDRPRDTFGLMT